MPSRSFPRRELKRRCWGRGRKRRPRPQYIGNPKGGRGREPPATARDCNRCNPGQVSACKKNEPCKANASSRCKLVPGNYREPLFSAQARDSPSPPGPDMRTRAREARSALTARQDLPSPPAGSLLGTLGSHPPSSAAECHGRIRAGVSRGDGSKDCGLPRQTQEALLRRRGRSRVHPGPPPAVARAVAMEPGRKFGGGASARCVCVCV